MQALRGQRSGGDCGSGRTVLGGGGPLLRCGRRRERNGRKIENGKG
jgi:hypothetical protein